MRLMYTSLSPVPRTGTLKDVREWVTASGVTELSERFRELLMNTRRNGITEQQVLYMAEDLESMVQRGKEAEQETVRKLKREGGINETL